MKAQVEVTKNYALTIELTEWEKRQVSAFLQNSVMGVSEPEEVTRFRKVVFTALNPPQESSSTDK